MLAQTLQATRALSSLKFANAKPAIRGKRHLASLASATRQLLFAHRPLQSRQPKALSLNNNNYNPHIRTNSSSSSSTTTTSKFTVQKRRSLKVELTQLPPRFSMEWPKITLFGDSITRRSTDVDNGCWGSMLNFKLGSYFDVDPRGFEGYNSKWGLELMPKLFPRSYLDKVELFVLFFGHNDAWEQPPTHQPVEDFDKNMRNIVKYLIDNGLHPSKILLITPAWFHLEDFMLLMKQMGLPPVKKELDDCERYSETLKKIGRDEQVEVLDFFTVTASYQPLEELFCDGVHFSRKGAKLLYDHLMPVVERKLEASFKKPLADLWHAVPFDQHPEVKAVVEAYQRATSEK